MSQAPYDPRAIANLILDEADRIELPLRHIALQKLLYFVHGMYLSERGKPLLSGYFEAWRFGPVHPTVYGAFKEAENRPVISRAQRVNVLTGQKADIASPTETDVKRLIERVLSSLGRLSDSRLVQLSHAEDGPWDFIVEKGKGSGAFGLRIPDEVILCRFKHHKVRVGDSPTPNGESLEDTPFA